MKPPTLVELEYATEQFGSDSTLSGAFVDDETTRRYVEMAVQTLLRKYPIDWRNPNAPEHRLASIAFKAGTEIGMHVVESRRRKDAVKS